MIKIWRGHGKVYLPISEYYELPSKYNKTIVRLLVQSPTRIFVYWEVSPETVKLLETQKINYSESTPILKISNVTMGYSYELKIDPFANNYYIEVKDADCEYQVELGRKFNNKFFSIYVSNPAKVPRNSPVPVEYNEEIVYRNCIKLSVTDKFTIYGKATDYADHNRIRKWIPQDYSNLPLASVDNRNNGSFGRYENGVSSMENVSSFEQYEDSTSLGFYASSNNYWNNSSHENQ